MTDVFLSYSHDDRERVRPIVTCLEAETWSVWWDRRLVPGERREEQLRDELKTGELSLSMFAADLDEVILKKGKRPIYR